MKRALRYRAMLGASVFAVLGFLCAADEPPQSVNAGGVKFEIPSSWKSNPPTKQMRLAEIKVAAAEGDTEGAEMVLFAFPGGAGGVEANLKRWREQFVGADGQPPKIESTKSRGKNVDVTVAEVAGRYVAAVSPGSPEKFDKPGYRLLGAMAITDDMGYFFRLVGPDKTVKAAKPGFEALVKSIQVGAK